MTRSMTILPAQSRAARALLNWSQDDLVDHSGITKKTIADFERGVTRPYPDTLEKLTAAFDAAGILWVFGRAPGVRLKGATQTKPSTRKPGRHPR